MRNENENLFIVIDGSSLMCTAYYGNLPNEIKYAKTEEEKEAHYDLIAQTSTGIYTNGIKSFLNTLFNLIDYQNPSHIAICFDQSRETTFRRLMYPEYKAQRTPTPEPLQKQMINIRTFLKAIGVPVLMSAEYEADDYAGSLCKTFEGRDMPVRFFTKDRDYLQLVSPYTKGWMMTHSEEKHTQLSEKYGYQTHVPFGCYEFDENTVLLEYGLNPSQVTDWKGISGDTSDNLPGIKGVADKSAIPLLKHYGTLDSVVRAVSDMEEQGKTDLLKSFWKAGLGISRPPVDLFIREKDTGLLCKELATLKTDLDVGELEDYETNIDYEKALTLARKLELDDLIPRIEAQARFQKVMTSHEDDYEEEYGHDA